MKLVNNFFHFDEEKIPFQNIEKDYNNIKFRSPFKNINFFHFFIIYLISFSTRFLFIGRVKNVAFDEMYFGSFINCYLNGSFFIDVHPPTGRLILTLTSYLFGYRGDCLFSAIHKPLTKDTFIIPRRVCAMYSSFVAPLIYLSMLNFSFSEEASFVAGLLIALEDSMILEGRIILTDGFLHCHVAITLFCLSQLIHYKALSKLWYIHFIILSFFIAITGTTKFTSLSLIPIVLIVVAFKIYLNDSKQEISLSLILKLILHLSTILIIFVIIYYTSSLIHAMRGHTYKDFQSPDCQTVEEEAWNLMQGKPFYLLPFIVIKASIAHNNNYVVDDFSKHPILAKWYNWPLMNYAFILMNYDEDRNIHTLLHYNFFTAYYGFFFVIFVYVPYLLNIQLIPNPSKDLQQYNITRVLFSFLFFLGYIFSYIPFYFVRRTTLSYHYIIPLMFLFLCISSSIDVFTPFHHQKNIYPIILVGLCLLSHLICFPLNYPVTFPAYAKTLFSTNKKWLGIGEFHD